jgi:hypothetical protein
MYMIPFQIHGPFNFADHRPEVKLKSSGSSSSLKRDTPPLVDLGSIPSPPVVDLSQDNAIEERRELLDSLTQMFPDTPRNYLVEQVEDLAGLPAATDRFVV